jgi:hypothetical protein
MFNNGYTNYTMNVARNNSSPLFRRNRTGPKYLAVVWLESGPTCCLGIVDKICLVIQLRNILRRKTEKNRSLAYTICDQLPRR